VHYLFPVLFVWTYVFECLVKIPFVCLNVKFCDYNQELNFKKLELIVLMQFVMTPINKIYYKNVTHTVLFFGDFLFISFLELLKLKMVGTAPFFNSFIPVNDRLISDG
jgi:hypothetical protein